MPDESYYTRLENNDIKIKYFSDDFELIKELRHPETISD